MAEDTAKRIQVTYATHSSYFIEAQHFDQVRRLTQSLDKPPIVSVHLATIADVKAKLHGICKDEVVDRQLDSIAEHQLAVALFAHRAFVVEGTTEAAVFYGIGDRTAPGFLESAGMAIVPVGGKNSIPLVHAILTAIGIPSYAHSTPILGARSERRRKINCHKISSPSANPMPHQIV